MWLRRGFVNWANIIQKNYKTKNKNVKFVSTNPALPYVIY